MVQFDGTDDWMATASFSVEQTQPYTVLMIFALRNTAANQRITDGTGAGRVIFRGTPAAAFDFYAGSAFIPTGLTTNTSWHTLYLSVNGAASSYSFEGASQTTFTLNPGSNTIQGLTIGANQGGSQDWSSLDLMEIIIWDGTLSAEDRTSALDYARTRGATW